MQEMDVDQLRGQCLKSPDSVDVRHTMRLCAGQRATWSQRHI